MGLRTVICVKCLAWMGCGAAAVLTGAAWAQDFPAPSRISDEVWLGLFSTVLFGLVAAYAKVQERRMGVAEFELKQQQSQINMLSERVLREHPSRQEMTDFRVQMDNRFDRLEQLLVRGRPHD